MRAKIFDQVIRGITVSYSMTDHDDAATGS
jgi:hypothetical protein